MARTIRQAIPWEELEANLKNEPKSTRRNRYQRTPTYISEADADARNAIGMIVLGLLGAFSVALSLWFVFARADGVVQPGEIYAKSEMTKAQVKSLNVVKPVAEKRHAHTN